MPEAGLHGSNFGCLKDYLLPEFDQAFSALVEDLNQRGMLDETLLLVTSEMGRQPKIGDRRSGGVSGGGRDHWTHCQAFCWQEVAFRAANPTDPVTDLANTPVTTQ